MCVIGKNIKILREKKGLSKKKLSELSGVSVSYISELENLKKNSPSIDIIDKLANALDVTKGDLLKENDAQFAENTNKFIIQKSYLYTKENTSEYDVSDNLNDINELIKLIKKLNNEDTKIIKNIVERLLK